MDLLNWFQVGPIPPDAMGGYYNFWLVVLSYIIAVLASYVALDFAGRLQEEPNNTIKIYWLLGGAFTMGAGIWSMHFIGMLAFVMPMTMGYDIAWTGGSLLVAMLASGLALYILRNKSYTATQLFLGGIFIGLGIATMHYMGMQGMTHDVNIRYKPLTFLLSIVIAITAAEAALWLALQSNIGSAKRQLNLKVISALVMGIAICGMHYVGMEAAVFTHKASHPLSDVYQAIQPDYLAFFVAGVTALIISLALTVSTYYKQMIKAVQQEKEFLNAMLNNLEDSIIACDADGQITVLNTPSELNIDSNMRKKSIHDIASYFELYTLDHISVPTDEYPLCRSLRGERIHDLPLIIKSKNHVDKSVMINAQPIIDKDGNKLGAVMVLRDVTELNKTEKLKSEFISIVSHELRTPLTSIRGSLGLLISGTMGDLPEKVEKLLTIANNNSERLLTLINDILDMEKIEAGKMHFDLKLIDINKLVSEAININTMYAEKYSVTLGLIENAKHMVVVGDSVRLMQVITNLISNACKFSPEGGKVTIAIDKLNEHTRVSVTDEGTGIPLEFQPRIFQRFSQADSSNTRGKGGTGLGLNISKTIIEKLGGTLAFITRDNKGSTFYFDLPICVDKPVTPRDSSPEPNADINKILICEDDQDQANYLRILLESAGYRSDIAYNVQQTKKLLKTNKYQVVLLDLILPDQDGISFIMELHAAKETSNLPIIVLSIIAQTGRTILKEGTGNVVDWLEKPLDFNRLLLSLKKLTKYQKLPEVLHVEDDVEIQHVISTLLQEYANITSVATLKECKETLGVKAFDLVILDLLLPDGNGREIIPMLAGLNIPILIFSATKLDQDYAKYVKKAIVKSNATNEELLKTIVDLLTPNANVN